MGSAPRYIARFESRDGYTVVNLPLDKAEQETSQELRGALVSAIGASYAVDLLGMLPAARGVARERIRATLYAASGALGLDSAIDALRADLYRIGYGKLWSVGADGSERWAWARLASMPTISISSSTLFGVPVVCEFDRLSDWYTDATTTVTASNPTSLSATNAGTADAGGLLFEITANGTGGWANPRVENDLTGEWWQVSRSAASGEILRVDTGRMAVETSTDGGATWVSAHPDLTTGDTLIGFLRLLPGGQTLTVSGCGDADVSLRFTAAWL